MPNPCRVSQTAPLRASVFVTPQVPETVPPPFVTIAPFASTAVPAEIHAPELTNTFPFGFAPFRMSVPLPNTPLPGEPETALKVPFVLTIIVPEIYNRPPVPPGRT